MALNLNIGITGSIMGMSAEALIFGFMGSLVYVMFGGVMNRQQSLSTVFVGMILAGVLSPLLLSYAIGATSIGTKAELLYNIVPFIVGFGWRFVLPLIVGYAENWIKNKLGENSGERK